MKKLNLNGPGTTCFYWGMAFLLFVPVTLYIVSYIFHSGMILLLIKISLIAGSLIMLSLFLLVGIELKQDSRINKIYEKNKNTRLRISDGCYECQNCGNRNVKNNEKYCNVCGIKFK